MSVTEKTATFASDIGYRAQELDFFPELSCLQQAIPERYPYLLESVSHGPSAARYDILFAFPQYLITLNTINTVLRDGKPTTECDFLGALERDWQTQKPATPVGSHAEGKCILPFQGGWFVYLGYELAAHIEPCLAGQLPEEEQIPVALAARCPAAIIRDHLQNRCYLVCESLEQETLLSAMREDLRHARSFQPPTIAVTSVNEDDPLDYLQKVQRVKDYISAGDVFQVNLSRSWHVDLDRPIPAVELYRLLRTTNPAPFAGTCHFGNGKAVISSSPERLVRVTGSTIHTRPIAGTYPRSSDRQQDRAWSEELLLNPKERAEHIMLLDLERNDLGRICRVGSVTVSELMVLETYRHVHHIVSEISGELRTGVTPMQVIRAVFPGGTITGCPKLRCMEIIAELEQRARGAYTGSMGYINRDGSMDLNILIRSMILNANRITIRAGAGIVADSNPKRELEETRAKARGLMAALGLS